MSTENIKSKTLQFIDYLTSNDKFISVLEAFKEYLKIAEYDRCYVIVYKFHSLDYEFGEIYSVCERNDSLIILAYGHYWNGKVTIDFEKYD